MSYYWFKQCKNIKVLIILQKKKKNETLMFVQYKND